MKVQDNNKTRHELCHQRHSLAKRASRSHLDDFATWYNESPTSLRMAVVRRARLKSLESTKVSLYELEKPSKLQVQLQERLVVVI